MADKSNSKMILFTPLDIPKIVPSDWDAWWDLWNNHAQLINKKVTNHNPAFGSPWKGFDLLNEFNHEVYEAAVAPKHPAADDLIEQVRTHCPFEPTFIRVMENLETIQFHSDVLYPKHEFRSVLWNTYPDSIWMFKYGDIVRQMSLPEDTNSFYYYDYPLKHAAHYDPRYSKGLLIVYGTPKPDFYEILNISTEKYKEVAWII